MLRLLPVALGFAQIGLPFIAHYKKLGTQSCEQIETFCKSLLYPTYQDDSGQNQIDIEKIQGLKKIQKKALIVGSIFSSALTQGVWVFSSVAASMLLIKPLANQEVLDPTEKIALEILAGGIVLGSAILKANQVFQDMKKRQAKDPVLNVIMNSLNMTSKRKIVRVVSNQ